LVKLMFVSKSLLLQNFDHVVIMEAF